MVPTTSAVPSIGSPDVQVMTVNAVDRAPPVGQRCPLRRGKGRAAGLAQGWVYFFQNRAVNNTSTDSSSSRPSNIAKVSTQIWTSVNTP